MYPRTNNEWTPAAGASALTTSHALSPLASTLALSAAALFVLACSKSSEGPDPASAATAPAESGETAAAEGGGDVKCLGINECKGQAQCGGVPGGHSCAGQNECKGKGWLKVSVAECQEKGGTPI